MDSSLVEKTRAKAAKPGVKKLVRYSAVSVIAVVITIVVQLVCLSLIHMGAWQSAVTASSIAAVPSYFLNRNWAWGKNGPSHFKKEVLPFWIMVFVGLGASMAASHFAESFARSMSASKFTQDLVITGASFLAFAVLWVLKFVIFNRLLFVHREEDLDPAYDGRAGIPT